MPAKFGIHFLPLTKNVPKRTKFQLNEIGLTKLNFVKSQSIKTTSNLLENVLFFSFCNTGVRVNVSAW